MFKRRFQRGLCCNQVKYARITITHVCFIALTLAGPSCSNSFLGTRQMLMHEKTSVIPIFTECHGASRQLGTGLKFSYRLQKKSLWDFLLNIALLFSFL